MIKPILIPTDNLDSKILLSKETRIPKLYYGDRAYGDVEYNKHIILVDTEAEIVDGDLVYSVLYGIGVVLPGNHSNYKGKFPRLVQYKGIAVPYNADGSYCNDGKKIYQNDCKKVVASTDKSLIAPFGGQAIFDNPVILSPNSIQLLINYYNEHKRMAESVEVEEEYIPGGRIEACPHMRKKGFGVQIKLNNKGEIDITIPEVEEKLYYCKAPSKMLPCSHYYKGGRCLHPSHCNFKAKEKLYTEEEMKQLLHECWIQCQKKMLGSYSRNGFYRMA